LLTVLLREQTRSDHDRIESALNLPDSIRDPSDYIRLLRGFYSFYEPLEQQLLSLDWRGTGIDMDARRKAPLLAADLHACGIDPTGQRLSPHVSRVDELAEGFGCLYVMEGATLGGELIVRRLETVFGAWLSGRDHFYRCYGDSRGRMWREFREAADRFGEQQDPPDQDRVIEAARSTFRQLQQWLEGR